MKSAVAIPTGRGKGSEGRRSRKLISVGISTLGDDDRAVVVLEGARHEVFNEFGKEQTIESVARFAERVTAR